MAINIGVAEKPMAQLKPRITVIGVGGGGGNAVNNMISKNLEGVDFVVANTDAQALENSLATKRIQIGLETTQGLGSGARPEVGKMSAEEAKEEISAALEGANMVFITAGMGGGTGSGAAPVVAKIAKDKGILTVGVVTKPFDFEGRKRQQIAENAVEEFTKEVDSIIIIPNQNLFRIADKNTTLQDAFVMADNVLYAGVRSITDLMMMPGLINLDFADVKSIMEGRGKAIMGTGEAEGEDRAIRAAEQALANPLLDDCSMHGAKGVLINITGSKDITLLEIAAAADRIKEEVDEDANIIFGSSFNESLDGKIRVSVVATGIGEGVASGLFHKQEGKKAAVYIDESYISPEEAAIPNNEVAPSVEEPKPIEEIADDFLEIQEEPKANVSDEFSGLDIEETLDAPAPFSIEDEIAGEDTQVLVNRAHDEDFDKFEDYDMLENSSVEGDMPKASSLFNAIINKPENAAEDETLEAIMPSIEDSFISKTQVAAVETEPELFAGAIREEKPEKEEPEVLIPSRKPTFLDRITGISIARKNRKKEEEPRFEPKTEEKIKNSDFGDDDIFNEEEKLNLDIPSFLRRS